MSPMVRDFCDARLYHASQVFAWMGIAAKEVRMRRIVYRHTAGPYPGLRQILAVASNEYLDYLHTRERRSLDPGPLPDMLAPVPMWPDGRMSKGMRLKSTDTYVLYQEHLMSKVDEGDENETHG